MLITSTELARAFAVEEIDVRKIINKYKVKVVGSWQPPKGRTVNLYNAAEFNRAWRKEHNVAATAASKFDDEDA